MRLTSQSTTPVRRVAAPLREQVLDGLREAIAAGEFAPGSRLSERELCERYDVSRTVVRETLRHLEAEGFVATIPHQGPFVAVLTKEDVADLYEVRGVLEALAAKLFTERASGEEVGRLEGVFDELEAARATGGVDEEAIARILELKDSFYTLLIDGARNRDLAGLLRTLHGRIQVLRRTTLASPSRPQQSTEELRAIVAAIAVRDAQGAHDASLEHVANAAKVALAEVEKAYGSEG